jgi:hypothetical protein
MSNTPETDEIKGQYERDYISVGKIIEHAEDLEMDRDKAIAERDESIAVISSLLEMGACVVRDYDIVENKRRRKMAQDFLAKINKIN